MSKLNKLVTNYPVSLSTEEVENLSATLAPVVAACGGGGGGGTPIYYYGDDVNINISPARVIRLTDAATAKLNRDIPTKVSDLTDSANYQTVAGMDQYLTELEAQSTYLTKSSADNDYAPLSTIADVEALKAASGDFSEYYKKTETSSKTELETEFAKYATTGEVDAIETDLETLSSTVTSQYATIRYVQDSVYDLATKSDLNKKQNKLVYDYDETGAISSIDGTPLAGQGGKTYSAGQYINIDSNDTISVTGLLALDEYAQYEPVLIGDSNITATSSKVNSHTQWNLAINSTPVVTDTKLVGENSITAHTTNVSGEWLVGLEQTAHNAIASIDGISTDVGTLKTASAGWNAKVDQSDLNDYLTKTQYGTDSATFALRTQLDDYATKGYADNASANALGEAKTWVGLQGYLTSVPDTYALKTDIPTTVAQLTDSGNYYQKTETSSKTEITNALNTKVDKPTSLQTGKLVYDGDTSAWVTLPAGTTTIVQGQGSVTATYDSSNSTYTVSLLASAENALNEVGDKIDTTAVAQTYQTISDMANYLTTSDAANTYQPKGNYAPESVTATINTLTAASARWDEVSAKLGTAQYANDSATFVTSSDSTITGTKQYALTTDGWAEVSTPTIPSITATSGISADGYTIGLTNTAIGAITSVSSKVDIPDTSLVDKYLALRTDNAGDVSGWVDLKDNFYSKTEATGTFVATANIDTTTLSGDGKSVSTKLGVKTDVIATRDYVSGNYLPTSGGTVTGQLEVHGGSNFDSQFIKLTREGNSCGARIGLGSDTTNGTLALKTFNGQGQNTVQVNIKHNTNNNELIQVQKNGTDIGFLIPAVTATTTAGLTNDGILHIILES